jgi:hypothetical protein
MLYIFILGTGFAVLHGGADLPLDLLHAGVLRQVLEKLGRLLAELLDLAVGEHHRADQFGSGAHARAGSEIGRQLEHFEYRALDTLAGAGQGVFAGRPVGQQFVVEGVDGIGMPPVLDLFFGAVTGSVGGRVAADPVGDRVQQHRPAAFLDHPPFAPEGVDYRQRIVAVDALGVHLVRVDAGADAGDKLHSHGLAHRLPAHAIKVVHAVENDRQSPAQRGVPQLAVLIHGGERDAFPHRAAGERGVADVAYHDPRLAVDSLVEGRAGGDRSGTAHDGVVRIDAERGEEGVHGAAQAAVEPGLPRENLAIGAVDEEAQRQALHAPLVSLLDRAQQGAVAVGFHQLQQGRVAPVPDGRKPFRQDLAVAAVRAVNMVVGSQRERHADGGRLLSDRQVRRAGVIISHALKRSLDLNFIQNGFELPNRAHVLPDGQEVFARIARPFFLRRALISIHLNVGQMDRPFGKYLFRFYTDRLGHSNVTPNC